MTQPDFHRLYSECEELERAELIEGLVYMPSPISIVQHARQQMLVLRWLQAYAETHEGVEAVGAGSVVLDETNEPIPDAMLYRLRAGRFTRGGFLSGAPELVFEVANSSRARDLHQKKRAYERNGVLEYLVWRVREAGIDWFQLRDRVYLQRTPDDRGIIESEGFPALKLNVPAMLAMDRKAVLGALSQ